MENTLPTPNTLPSDLAVVKELVYDKCGFHFSNFKQNDESADYGACSFELNGKKIQHRISKITPTKTGQFVTIWKRNDKWITEPFNISDNFDFVIITARNDENFGQFIFPKSVLVDKGIVSQNEKGGKRGIRVYAPWDKPINKQAIKTQAWQLPYFVEIKENTLTDLEKINRILSNW